MRVTTPRRSPRRSTTRSAGSSSPRTTRPGRSWSSTATCWTTWCFSCWSTRRCHASRCWRSSRRCTCGRPAVPTPATASGCPSEKPPVLTPKELALTAAADGRDLPQSLGNGQGASAAGLPAGPRRSRAASRIRWVAAPLGGGNPLGGASPLGGGNPFDTKPGPSRPRQEPPGRRGQRRRRGSLSDGGFDLPRIERAVREILARAWRGSRTGTACGTLRPGSPAR